MQGIYAKSEEKFLYGVTTPPFVQISGGVGCKINIICNNMELKMLNPTFPGNVSRILYNDVTACLSVTYAIVLLLFHAA